MKRWLCAFLAFVMLAAAIPVAYAHEFTDISGHWAEAYIEEAVENELFHGTTQTTFSPQADITRGMFVTVLGRLEGIDPSLWSADRIPQIFADVNPTVYYSPYISWAYTNGIVDGVGDGRFSPEAPITREQMCKLLITYSNMPGHGIDAEWSDDPITYVDSAQISSWASFYVEAAGQFGLMNGSKKNDGYYFRPRAHATRAEAAAVFCRLSEKLINNSDLIVMPTSIRFEPSHLTVTAGGSVPVEFIVTPGEALYSTPIRYHVSDPSVCGFNAYGSSVVGLSTGHTTIIIYTGNGLSAKCEVNVVAPTFDDLPSANESYYQKCIRVFGEYVQKPNQYAYNMTEAEARALTELVTVPIWRIGNNGSKYSTTMNVRVHKALAPAVKQIFTEIYNGKEQFPFHEISGFTFRAKGTSEHYWGGALDLNPNENPYYNSGGVIQVGSHYRPGVDPYSIPVGGEVDQIFAKYGFTRGIYWNSGAKDYMHYSFFGT